MTVPLIDVSCPGEGKIIDIETSFDPAEFKAALANDGTTVRLGPNVDLDFSDMPSDFFPISLGRCVTLTSVNALKTSEARSSQSLGPVLRYGKHPEGAGTFLAVNCSEHAHDHVRISGFRLLGPDQQEFDDYGIKITQCVDVEIFNMEIAGWGGAGIRIEDDDGESGRRTDGGRITDFDQIKIHNNFIHHNQHPSVGGHATGYGVVVSGGAWTRISENVFDFNRHAIAAAYDAGGYVAERNLVLKGGGYHGKWYSNYTHIFDVHGSGCWWSSDLCGDAGIKFFYVANAFQYHKDQVINIRGKPAVLASISLNVFPHDDVENFWGDGAVKLDTSENVNIRSNNVTGVDTYGNYGVCDFDGDGVDDLFLATGATWWFSSFGEFHWSYLSARTERLDQVRLGYFDNDERCDVLTQSGAEWVIASGGTGPWQSIGVFGAPLGEVAFGQFDPNFRDHRPGVTRRTTHVFWRTRNGAWLVTQLTAPAWQEVQNSSFPMSKLRFGDFTGDGVTDVLAVENGRWSISESARGNWQTLNQHLSDDVSSLLIADLNNNNIDDLIRLEWRPIDNTFETWIWTWWVSDDGRSPWRKLNTYTVPHSVDVPVSAFAGRFGVAPGGGVLLIDHNRIGRFYSEAEIVRGASPDWTSLFPY